MKTTEQQWDESLHSKESAEFIESSLEEIKKTLEENELSLKPLFD